MCKLCNPDEEFGRLKYTRDLIESFQSHLSSMDNDDNSPKLNHQIQILIPLLDQMDQELQFLIANYRF